MGRDKLPPESPRGITIRAGASGKQSIVINFMFRGVQCRETLKNIEATKANIKYAAGLKAEIDKKISQGSFSYVDYFPSSKRAILFGHVINSVKIETLLDEFMLIAEKTLEKSSLDRYQSVIRTHLKPAFGKIAAKDLTPAHIRNYIKTLNIKIKSVRNMIIPLRHVLDQAVNDDIITKNPIDRVVIEKLVSKEQMETDYVVDPFDELERKAIINAAKGQARNLIQFDFYTGLRPSELIGLEWASIDWIHGTVRVQNVVVNRHEKKRTKTKAGMRDVILLPAAMAALKAQKEYTFLGGGRVFHHPITNKPLEHDDQIRRAIWIGALKKAGVRYRNPYQMRHTYASMLLSAGENMVWLATQMGHVDTEMIIRTYGKWIPDKSRISGYQFVGDWTEMPDKTEITKSA